MYLVLHGDASSVFHNRNRIYKNSLKCGYTGERELGTKSTNYRKRQEDTEPDSLVRFQQRVSIYGRVPECLMAPVATRLIRRLKSYPDLQFVMGECAPGPTLKQQIRAVTQNP